MGIYMVWQVHHVHWKGQHSGASGLVSGASGVVGVSGASGLVSGASGGVALILTTKKSSGNWSQVPLAKILGFDSATKCYILNSIA